MLRGLAGAAALLAVAALPAAARAELTVSRVDPGAAVAGAALDVKGSDLRGARVTLGGKSARVLSARAGRLRFVVPRLRPGTHRLVVRRGSETVFARLRVLRPFDGRIRLRPDRARAKKARIGTAGGVVKARGRDGTTYTLRVPAGALSQRRAITVTPARALRGLPFTGRARGADLAPDGLEFAEPATLTIKSKRAFERATVGFAHTGGRTSLDMQRVRGSGRVRRIPIEHFSTGAVAGTSPADFANAVAPLLVEQPMREDVIALVTDLIGAYEEAFGAGFCASQPACGDAAAQSLDSLDTRIEGRCTDSRQNAPTLRALRDIVRMEALRARLGGDGDTSLVCREEIMRGIFEPARNAVCGAAANPLGGRAAASDLLREDGGGGDLDADGELTHLEFMFFLISPMQAAGLTDMGSAAQTCAFTALEALPAAGRTLCETNRAQAERDLQRALDYAQALDLILLQPYIDALDFCRIELEVAPASVTLAADSQQQFAAIVTGVLDEPTNGGVTWSATGGTIGAAGFYTAPSTPGTYEVRATSARNPARSATATVTVTDQGPLDPNMFTVELVGGTCDPPSTITNDCFQPEGEINFTISITSAASRTAQVTVDFTTAYRTGVLSNCSGYNSPTLDIGAGQTLSHDVTITCTMSPTGGTSAGRNATARACLTGGGCGPADTEEFWVCRPGSGNCS